jgi:hypothetical protein
MSDNKKKAAKDLKEVRVPKKAKGAAKVDEDEVPIISLPELKKKYEAVEMLFATKSPPVATVTTFDSNASVASLPSIATVSSLSFAKKNLVANFDKAFVSLPSGASIVTPEKGTQGGVTSSFLSGLGLAADTSVSESHGIASIEGKKKVGIVTTSRLKAAILRTENGYGIAFRTESKWRDTGSWANKCFREDVYDDRKQWTQELNFISHKKFYWHHENQPMRDAKGYNINIYIACFQGKITEAVAIEIGKYVVTNVNLHKDQAKLAFEEQDYFWLSGVNEWANVLGFDVPYKLMVEIKGHPEKGYYAKNKKFIDSMFPLGCFDKALCDAMDAPPECLHPSFRVSEGNDESL